MTPEQEQSAADLSEAEYNEGWNAYIDGKPLTSDTGNFHDGYCDAREAKAGELDRQS